jgi:hypothetical protein
MPEVVLVTTLNPLVISQLSISGVVLQILDGGRDLTDHVWKK